MKNLSRVRSILFLILIFVIAILSVYNTSGSDFLISENRKISEFPKISSSSLLDGKFVSGIETYFDDRFFAREEILEILAKIDMYYLKKPLIMDVVLSTDRKYLLDHITYSETKDNIKNMSKGVDLLGRVQRYVEEQGGTMLTIVFPRQSFALSHLYPEYMFSKYTPYTEIKKQIDPLLKNEGINLIDLYDELSSNPKKYYYTSDHHPNYEAMLVAYDKIIDRMHQVNLPYLDIRNEMKMNKSSKPFIGSLNRKIFNLHQVEEHLPYYELDKPIAFRRFEEGKEVSAKIFYEDYPYYHFYMGGDKAYTKIVTERNNLPNILVIGDSTTNALETLIWSSANNFVSVDFRHYKKESVFEIIKREKPDFVIFTMINGYYNNIESILK